MKLTDRKVQHLKPESNRYEIWEGNGFGIRVFPTGKKSWVFMYRLQGKLHRLTLGQYPNMSVAEAHAEHGKALTTLEKGIDPGEEKVTQNVTDRKAPTVESLVSTYIEKWAKPRKRSWEEDERMLKKDVIPIWGNRKAHSISKKDVIGLLDNVVNRGATITANRTLAVIRRMFNFAVERDILKTTPCYRIKAPFKENKNDRVLSEKEIQTLWNGLNKASILQLTRLAVKLQLVTAQRKWEIVSSEWHEFDLKNKWWNIPKEKAKNGIAHRVPLSEIAMSILLELKKISGESQWVFQSPRTVQHIGSEAINHAIRKNFHCFKDAKHFTPHDLRRTAATYMTSLGTPRLVVSKILNHVESSITSIYDKHSYDKEKREAMDKWSKKLKQILK